MKLEGTMSCFGGPDDDGMKYDEGLSFWEHWEADNHPELFLPRSKDLIQGVSKRLRSNYAYYIALNIPKGIARAVVHNSRWKIENLNNNDFVIAQLVDGGPGANDRLVDASDAVFHAIGLSPKMKPELTRVSVQEVSQFNIPFGIYKDMI